MAQFSQKSIEHFFKQYKVTDSDKKAKLLHELTDIIYDYNMLIVDYEKEGDEYKKQQIANDIQELEDKIDRIFKENK